MKHVLLVVALIVIIGGVTAFALPFAESVRNFIPLFIPSGDQLVDGIDQNGTSSPLTVPTGFSISVFARGLEDPRDITRGPAGRLLVSEPDAGRVVALQDEDGDHRADAVVTVLSGLNRPHGLASYCTGGDEEETQCFLYVAETDKVVRFPYDAESATFGEPEHIIDLPAGGRHFTRSILITPEQYLREDADTGLPQAGDEKLVISVGSSCNVCFEENDKRAAILVTDLDGGNLEIISGLRNAVFLAQHAVTGDVWATEMGRDNLGDDLPPDEINIIKLGNDYGFPICYGKNIHDSEFDTQQYIQDPCIDRTPAHINIEPAHSSPLGISFVPEEGWPEDFWYDAIVALHGSWNRSEPSGYKVVRYHLTPEGGVERTDTGEPVVSDFITGFRTESGKVLGRPADVYLEPGGVGYITDDRAGAVYKIIRNAE